jgi:enediyne biosynthesis protein E4
MKSFFTHTAFIIWLAIAFVSCNQTGKTNTPLFKTLTSKETGLNFSNTLKYSNTFNLFKYMYFYNGSGVGAADFNNDGLTDLFFGSNQSANQLYLNEGNLHFKNITQQAAIPDDGGWTTGISVVDINNDGYMDIYVCRVGNYEILKSKNLLLINQGPDKNGVPIFMDKAAEYGLDFSGFSTQAAFFDYDLDGDLDMFLLNHSVHENGTFRPRKDFQGTYHPLSGHRLYRNDGGKYTDATHACGINSTAIGYGLGITVSDINLDGWPDIYIGNDFHENDYLYINQHNGTFTDEAELRTMHTSQFSMGVDVADINNDAFPEIISADMLPADPYILKRSLGEDAYDIFNYKISVGYAHQYTRNNLQYNRRNGLFSEIGLYSGVAATDWSWATLWMDFDNDGLKDLFISNGIPKRMNDIDYINFVTQGDVQQMIRSNNIDGKDLALINKFPEIKLPNKFFRNGADLTFEDIDKEVKDNPATFSNGAVYADLDNDGDLDIVVNNIDASVLVYQNTSASPARHTSITLQLEGPSANKNATGAKVLVYAGQQVRTYEKYPVRGFLSSMEIPVQAGIRNHPPDSIRVIWPDNSFQSIIKPDTSFYKLLYKKGLPVFDYSWLTQRIKPAVMPVTDITAAAGLNYLHQENHFVEFDREPLIPHMVSTEGPALAVADINHDGLDDIFFGAARGKKPALFVQTSLGKFIQAQQPALDLDSVYEDTGASFADINNDGHTDLIVVSGGNEFFGNDFHNAPRAYLNDGKGNFIKLANAFNNLFLTASCLAPFDFNGDGYVDIFIGARAVPWAYGQLPASYLLQNDGNGHFTNVTKSICPQLANAGMITDAVWMDIDKDGLTDLLITQEWGGIDAYLNKKGQFEQHAITDKKGWWNFIYPCDIDLDGDMDFIAGNLGLNSRLKASEQQPLRLYYNDFDGNGKKEQVLTYYLAGKEIPFANKAELEKQMPILKKKFLYANDFAKATLTELFGKDKLNTAGLLTASYMANALLINEGDMQFTVKALPAEAQFSSMKTAAVVDANNDNLPDILIMGNYYDCNIEMGRYDADYGTVLINKGKGNFEVSVLNGIAIKGQVRHLLPIHVANKQAYILAKNNDLAMLLQFGKVKK